MQNAKSMEMGNGKTSIAKQKKTKNTKNKQAAKSNKTKCGKKRQTIGLGLRLGEEGGKFGGGKG